MLQDAARNQQSHFLSDDLLRQARLTLLPRSQMRNSSIERMERPHEEAGERKSEREDEEKDPCAALFDQEEDDAD